MVQLRLKLLALLVVPLTLSGCSKGFWMTDAGHSVFYPCETGKNIQNTRLKYIAIQSCRVDSSCLVSGSDMEFKLNYEQMCAK